MSGAIERCQRPAAPDHYPAHRRRTVMTEINSITTSNGLAARFWLNVQKTEGCWLWTGRRDGAGYGQIFVQGRRIGVHRLSWLLNCGEIPEGLFVCHHCDVPLCVRPDHLFVGTHDDNMRDAAIKGRMAHTSEHIKKRTAASKGRPFSAEHRANISAAMTGGKWTDERRRQMSAIRKSLHYWRHDPTTGKFIRKS